MRKTRLIHFVGLFILAVSVAAVKPYLAYGSDEVFGFSSEAGSSSESYLGVDTRDITPDRLVPLKLKEERGVEVTMVDQDAPAGKSGVKEHDVILSVNGTQIESVEQLRRMIHEIPAGRSISVGLSRNGQALTIQTQLATRKHGYAMAWPHGENFNFSMPPIPPMPVMPAMPEMDLPASIVVVHSSTRSGLMVENLTPQLGEYFGIKGGQGILVRSVEKGSRAETAGFRAGDVIIRINGQKIADSEDFTRAVNSRKDNTVRVSVLRDRKELNFTLTLPEHSPSGEILNETFNIPEMDARVRTELVRAQSEVARLQPEIQHEMELHAADMQRAQKEVQARTADIQRIAPEIRRANSATREQLRQMEREIKRRTMELQKQMLKRLSGDADI